MLKIPSDVSDQSWFNFVVNASGDVNFSGSHQVQALVKTHSLFIQTDKYLYKPGQKGLLNGIKLINVVNNCLQHMCLHYRNYKYIRRNSHEYILQIIRTTLNIVSYNVVAKDYKPFLIILLIIEKS